MAAFGNTFVWGAYQNNITGAVYVYDRNSQIFLSHFICIVPSEIGQDAYFLYSVNIDDGIMIMGTVDDQDKNIVINKACS